jgi:hypothetical protein
MEDDVDTAPTAPSARQVALLAKTNESLVAKLCDKDREIAALKQRLAQVINSCCKLLVPMHSILKHCSVSRILPCIVFMDQYLALHDLLR